MKLPNYERAFVDPAKILSYLLSTTHPVGFAKARYFRGLGFRRRRWAALHRALLEHARTGEVIRADSNPFGQKYVVEGILSGPGGRSAVLISVWLIRDGEHFPRLVTAYPADAP